MIPESEYVTIVGGPTCVTWALVRKYHPDRIDEFYDWMTGQGGLVSDTGEHLLFASDYERWLSGACVVD